MRRFGSVGTCSNALSSGPIDGSVPGSELLEALLMVSSLFGAADAAGAEAAGWARRRDQSWHGIDCVRAARSQASQAIGAKEGARLGASCHAQQ
jgi:hypothetical protein